MSPLGGIAVRKLQHTHLHFCIINGVGVIYQCHRTQKVKARVSRSLMRTLPPAVTMAGNSWDHKPQTPQRNLATKGHRINDQCSCGSSCQFSEVSGSLWGGFGKCCRDQRRSAWASVCSCWRSIMCEIDSSNMCSLYVVDISTWWPMSDVAGHYVHY